MAAKIQDVELARAVVRAHAKPNARQLPGVVGRDGVEPGFDERRRFQGFGDAFRLLDDRLAPEGPAVAWRLQRDVVPLRQSSSVFKELGTDAERLHRRVALAEQRFERAERRAPDRFLGVDARRL